MLFFGAPRLAFWNHDISSGNDSWFAEKCARALPGEQVSRDERPPDEPGDDDAPTIAGLL